MMKYRIVGFVIIVISESWTPMVQTIFIVYLFSIKFKSNFFATEA